MQVDLLATWPWEYTAKGHVAVSTVPDQEAPWHPAPVGASSVVIWELPSRLSHQQVGTVLLLSGVHAVGFSVPTHTMLMRVVCI